MDHPHQCSQASVKIFKFSSALVSNNYSKRHTTHLTQDSVLHTLVLIYEECDFYSVKNVDSHHKKKCNYVWGWIFINLLW